MIKAIFFDIDGTLVSFKTHTIPQSTLDALAELRKRQIKIFIATGRPYHIINNLGNETFDGYITVNGGCCLTADLEVIYKNPIPADNITSLLDFLEGDNPFPCMAATAECMYINYIDENVEKILELIDISSQGQVKKLKEIGEKEVLQLMGYFDNNREGKILAEVLPGCEATRWSPLFTDIVAKGNSKQIGIDKILQHFDIDLKDTMAFGDGGNDIQMLRHIPLSIAMGNASDDVKQAASYVTDSVDDNGIWNALKHFGVI